MESVDDESEDLFSSESQDDSSTEVTTYAKYTELLRTNVPPKRKVVLQTSDSSLSDEVDQVSLSPSRKKPHTEDLKVPTCNNTQAPPTRHVYTASLSPNLAPRHGASPSPSLRKRTQSILGKSKQPIATCPISIHKRDGSRASQLLPVPNCGQRANGKGGTSTTVRTPLSVCRQIRTTPIERGTSTPCRPKAVRRESLEFRRNSTNQLENIQPDDGDEAYCNDVDESGSRFASRGLRSESTSSTPSQDMSGAFVELQKTNELLTKLISQMKRTEHRVQVIEEKLDSTSSKTRKSEKKPVPPAVRREVKRVYHTLVKEVKEFHGWTVAPGVIYRSSENQAVLDHLIREVKGLNPDMATQDIKDAGYRFYRSCCEQKSVERRGVAEQRSKHRRRRERINRKLQERKAALAKMTFTDERQREKWLLAMRMDIMSSEESEIEGDDDVIIIKPLPWRSNAVNEMIQRLDARIRENRSSQARRQAKTRDYSSLPSSRGKPILGDLPKWLFKE